MRSEARGTRTIPLRDFAFRVARAYRLFRSPLWVRVQGRLGFRIVTLEDAKSGFRFRCRAGAERMFHEIFTSHQYDIPLAPVRSGDLVLDVGANHGFASVDFARRGADVRAFEPSRDVFALLCENVSRNGLREWVKAECAAVTDRDGEAELFETPSHGGGMSSLERRYVEVTNIAVSACNVVPTRSIRSVLEILEGRRVRLLKLDCEGSELKILGSLGTEERAGIDSVALEYHPGVYGMPELMAILRGWTEFEISKPSWGDAPNLILHLVRREVVEDTLAGSACR